MSYIAEIPYGCYWSTPFVRWQGSFAHLHAMEFAAHVAKQELAKRQLPAAVFDCAVMGISVPQKHSFFGTPWITAMLGAPQVTGQTISQACATGVRCLLAAVQEIQVGLSEVALSITCDHLSNGPHLYYPNPGGPGGTGDAEDWVMDNFSYDPVTTKSMLVTAENVAREFKLDTARQHDLVLHRQEQYAAALANDSAFLKRFMTLPFDVPSANFKKLMKTLDGDEGIVRSTADGLAKLKPVMPDGTITFGCQTHPADANAAIILAKPGRARELSKNPRIAVRLRGFGMARVEPAFMPKAPVPAARKALAQAGIGIDKVDVIKLHNPFTANDFAFAIETGVDVRSFNNYGSSLLWGHPQAPMGTRGVIEVIEELAIRGGGIGMFAGCAAGDSAMAVVLEVGDAK
ncbi:MAG: thiolase family protein [Beijerinckiaceae bacterium]